MSIAFPLGIGEEERTKKKKSASETTEITRQYSVRQKEMQNRTCQHTLSH